ncbi:MAG: immune inhibitor A, partial [Candidatus Eisenbacteria bacterium]|nr:immune inhibitor A [Candidatus Eisenbacteria bacterium]
PLGSVSGVVSFDGVPVADAPIELRGTALSGRTSADGSYAIGAVPVDRYLVCAGPVPGSGTAWSWVSTSPTDVALPLELCPAQTFEDGAAEYTADPGWSLGTPSRGPSAHSGTHVWGTGLHGDYGSTLRIALTSPELTLGAATSIHLSFSQWYRIESAWDGGQVQVWDGVEWKIVEPIGGYPMQALSGLNWGPGYSGASDGWEPALFDLSAEARDGLRIRFVFGSDESITDLGWYLDDIAIETDLAPTAAPEADAATNGLDAVLSGGFPNPFRTSTHLRCRIPEAGVYGLTIHDPNGRVVRTLLNAPLTAGRSEVVWNGDDDQGRSVPAGVYYARLAHQGRVVGACSLLRIR